MGGRAAVRLPHLPSLLSWYLDLALPLCSHNLRSILGYIFECLPCDDLFLLSSPTVSLLEAGLGLCLSCLPGVPAVQQAACLSRLPRARWHCGPVSPRTGRLAVAHSCTAHQLCPLHVLLQSGGEELNPSHRLTVWTGRGHRCEGMRRAPDNNKYLVKAANFMPVIVSLTVYDMKGFV